MSRSRVLAVAVVVAATAAGLAPAGRPARAAAPPVVESTAVPADGVFHLEGHGWGHGHGLSQWSAQGAALSGVDARTVLDHAYPGTTQVVTAARSVRVLLSADEGADLEVYPADGLGLTDGAQPRTVLPTGPAYQRWRVAVRPGSFVLQAFDGGAWSSVGGPLTGPVVLDDAAALVRVGLPDGTSRAYRGTVAAVRSGDSAMRSVTTVALEDYLRGVVPRESPSSWGPAALQAQAVAARSYATYLADHAPAGRSYDLCDSDACQVYGGAHLWSGSGDAPLETPSTDAAVAATAGQVRQFQGAAVFAEFASSNGGWSAAGSQPYLAATADPWDGVDPHNTSHTWAATVTAQQLQQRFPAVGTLTALEVTRRDGNGEWGGRVQSVVLHGRAADGSATAVTTTGSGVYGAHAWPRSSDGLRSEWWHVLGAPVAAAAAAAPPGPPTVGLVATSPRVLLESGRFPLRSTEPRTVPVVGRAGVPVGAVAALLVATTTGGPRAASLDAWATGSGRETATRLGTVARGLPATGTALVPLGPDGSVQVAPSSGTTGGRVTVVGYAVPRPAGGVLQPADPVTALDALLRRAGTAALGPAPDGATAALLAVTATAPTGPGRVTVGGVAVTPYAAGQPVSGTALVPLTPGGQVPVTVTGAPTGVRVEVVGWLVPAPAPGAGFVVVGSPTRLAPQTVSSRGAMTRFTGGAVPARTRLVLAQVTLTSPRAGWVRLQPHALAALGARAWVPAGRPVTTLVLLSLADARVTARPAGAPLVVGVDVLGWTPPGTGTTP